MNPNCISPVIISLGFTPIITAEYALLTLGYKSKKGPCFLKQGPLSKLVFVGVLPIITLTL